jgi:hypothetical protein
MLCSLMCCIIDSRNYVDRHATGRLRVVVDGRWCSDLVKQKRRSGLE